MADEDWIDNSVDELVDVSESQAPTLRRPLSDLGARAAIAPTQEPTGPAYPSAATSLQEAREYDTAYGHPAAGYINKNAVVTTAPIHEAASNMNYNQPFNKQEPVDDAVATQMAQAFAASRRSAVAGLGFDPRRIAVSPPQGRTTLPLAGSYTSYEARKPLTDREKEYIKPKNDQIWYDMNYPVAATHESIHRGIQQLRNAGEFPYSTDEDMKHREELIVRAVMQRFYGDAERELGSEQIDEARRKIPSKLVDEIEEKAARLIAKKQPRGPR